MKASFSASGIPMLSESMIISSCCILRFGHHLGGKRVSVQDRIGGLRYNDRKTRHGNVKDAHF
jgi:hypothetical protein